jgi:flagellar hook-basal body complex protein FliE
MIVIPPIGGLSGGVSSALSSQPGANPAENLQGASAAAGQAEGLTLSGSTGAEGTSGGSGFGSSLTEAISSLEKTQQSSDSASQELASGTVKDPEAAVTTVEDAALSMQLAAQIRTKATEATQTIFQTQV